MKQDEQRGKLVECFGLENVLAQVFRNRSCCTELTLGLDRTCQSSIALAEINTCHGVTVDRDITSFGDIVHHLLLEASSLIKLFRLIQYVYNLYECLHRFGSFLGFECRSKSSLIVDEGTIKVLSRVCHIGKADQRIKHVALLGGKWVFQLQVATNCLCPVAFRLGWMTFCLAQQTQQIEGIGEHSHVFHFFCKPSCFHQLFQSDRMITCYDVGMTQSTERLPERTGIGSVSIVGGTRIGGSFGKVIDCSMWIIQRNVGVTQVHEHLCWKTGWTHDVTTMMH
mmetsp:Transcript_4862/g.12111  ORF Transcript_4862/g.12111 Transcript_4862/m.12111 type:complete len:282 (-) Transcript_4862:913-1758(-)